MIRLNKAKIIQLNPIQGTKMNEDVLKNMIHKLSRRAEYEVSDSYRYRPVSESVIHNNKDYKAIALSISQDEDKLSGHMLEISVLHPSMSREYKRPLVYGDKNTIVKYLNDSDVVKNIKLDLNAILQEIKLT